MLTSEIIAHNLYGMIDTFTTVKLNDTTKVLIPRTGVNTSYQRAVIIDQLYNIVLCPCEDKRRRNGIMKLHMVNFYSGNLKICLLNGNLYIERC